MKRLLASLLLASSTLSAQLIDWVDWTSGSPSASTGVATGVLTTPSVTVTYTGHILEVLTGTGSNFWTESTPAPYTGNAVIGNAPDSAEMIRLYYASTNNTVTFSDPVLNPVMALLSVGQPSFAVHYAFNQPFTVLSEGRGFFGDGSYSVSGNTLIGNELHGAIQFHGWVSSISWSNPQFENWHGFTFGVPVPEIPEPSAIAALGLFALVAFLCFHRRRQRA